MTLCEQHEFSNQELSPLHCSGSCATCPGSDSKSLEFLVMWSAPVKPVPAVPPAHTDCPCQELPRVRSSSGGQERWHWHWDTGAHGQYSTEQVQRAGLILSLSYSDLTVKTWLNHLMPLQGNNPDGTDTSKKLWVRLETLHCCLSHTPHLQPGCHRTNPSKQMRCSCSPSYPDLGWLGNVNKQITLHYITRKEKAYLEWQTWYFSHFFL